MYFDVAPSHRSVTREQEYGAIHKDSNTATFLLLKEANELQCGFHRLCFELMSHEGKLVCGNMRGQNLLHLPSLSVLRNCHSCVKSGTTINSYRITLLRSFHFWRGLFPPAAIGVSLVVWGVKKCWHLGLYG